MAEDIGLAAPALVQAGVIYGFRDGRRDRVHVFELRPGRLPPLHLDNREIVAARPVSPDEWRGMSLTAPVAIYLGRIFSPAGHM